MSILKLANAGDEATLEIAACNLVQGEYGEQVRFDTRDDVTLYLPKASADRQLERIGLLTVGEIGEYDGVIGQTLVFSRTPNSKPGSKPYWNINVAKPNGKPPVAAPAFPRAGSVQPHPTGAPPKPPPFSHANRPEAELPPFLRDAEAEDRAELSAKVGVDLTGIQKDCAIYQAQTEFVLEHIAPLYVKAGIGMSPESAAACVQTLFINSAGGKK